MKAIMDRNPAKKTGLSPVLTTLITTWFIPNNAERAIKAIVP